MIPTYSLKRRAWTVYTWPRGGIAFRQLTDYHQHQAQALNAAKHRPNTPKEKR